MAELVEALQALLKRDERNTCQHEETHRGGVLWEICDACGAQWADDRGGKPEWQDPPEWVNARAVLAKVNGTEKAQPLVPLTDEQIAKLLDAERMRWAGHNGPPTYDFAPAFVRAVVAAFCRVNGIGTEGGAR